MAHVPDASLRHIQALSPDIQQAAWYMVWRVRTAGFPLQITASVRTREEAEALRRSGFSNTLRSKHLVGQAFDVDLHGIARDQIPMWFWDELGRFGETLGFRWGGRWSNPWDPGHFENPYVVV